MATRDWGKDPVDVDYFIESGLLFELNRQFLHPLGLGLTVRVDQQGNKTWGFKDSRDEPGALKFDREALESGRRKFVRFLRAFGSKQMHKREKKLGLTVQHVEPNWD